MNVAVLSLIQKCLIRNNMCSKHKIPIWNKMIDNSEFSLTLL
jgi:hypothetical protein